MKRILVCAVILLAVSSCAFSADNSDYVVLENIEGEGSTRDEAIKSAWRAGIREAVGSFIDSKTELNNDQLTERIIAYNRGLVEKYEVTAVDDSRAAEGIYRLKMKLWILRDVLRDGAKHVTAGTAEISFSPEDVKRRKEELNAKALESRDSVAETAKAKAKTGANLLSAMLARYKPEDFLTCYIPGKPEPVKGKPDMYVLNVEVNFNAKLYKESFVPDLEQVLDQIAAAKRSNLLTKQKTALRTLSANKALPDRKASVVFEADHLGKEYTLAVYDRPERFGAKLYAFRKEDTDGINKVLAEYAAQTLRVQGVVLELQDEERETLETINTRFGVKYLLSEKSTGAKVWAVHNTIMDLTSGYHVSSTRAVFSESQKLVVPVELEMPEEVLPYIKFFKVSLLIDKPAELQRGWLGISCSSNNDSWGAYVNDVANDSAAYKAGIREGNYISSINGKRVQNGNEVVNIISQYYAGETVVIGLYGAGKHDNVRLSVVLGENP